MRMAMIAITTKSSISVKPRKRGFCLMAHLQLGNRANGIRHQVNARCGTVQGKISSISGVLPCTSRPTTRARVADVRAIIEYWNQCSDSPGFLGMNQTVFWLTLVVALAVGVVAGSSTAEFFS